MVNGCSLALDANPLCDLTTPLALKQNIYPWLPILFIRDYQSSITTMHCGTPYR